MPDRWSPVVGAVGFDGGHRPAVALTIPPSELTSDEGEQEGGGGGPGACCYNDGTCDTISEIDCISAGGTFQGEGTTCDDVNCTGACCEPGCVEDTTPDGCDLDGGTFQGFGTTCDPDPCTEPTGACCVDTDCTIETESDCTDMSGTYQGDDTTCDPNPCAELCVCGGFLNPDDGLYYNTKIYTYSVDNSTCPSGFDCLCFSGPNPDPIQYPCGSNRWTFVNSYTTTGKLSSEHYDEECNLIQAFDESETSEWLCCCFSFCDTPTDCTPYVPGTCPGCEGEVLPEIWTHCATVTQEVSYEDPCIPM